MKLFDRIFPPQKITLDNGHTVLRPRSRAPLITLVIVALTAVSVYVTGFSFGPLAQNGDKFFSILASMVPPKWSYAHSVWQPLIDTIKMSLFGSVMGAIAAVPFALLAANNVTKSRLVQMLAKLFLSILRTLPSLVTALIATYIFGLGTFAGTVAIFLFSLSYVGKILYEAIESVDMGAFEVMESMGMTRFYAFRYAIMPLVMPTYMSTLLFNFEGNVRYAAILGYVGAGGIGLILNEKLGWRDYSSVGMILLLLLCTVMIIESISQHFRKRLE